MFFHSVIPKIVATTLGTKKVKNAVPITLAPNTTVNIPVVTRVLRCCMGDWYTLLSLIIPLIPSYEPLINPSAPVNTKPVALKKAVAGNICRIAGQKSSKGSNNFLQTLNTAAAQVCILPHHPNDLADSMIFSCFSCSFGGGVLLNT